MLDMRGMNFHLKNNNLPNNSSNYSNFLHCMLHILWNNYHNSTTTPIINSYNSQDYKILYNHSINNHLHNHYMQPKYFWSKQIGKEAQTKMKMTSIFWTFIIARIIRIFLIFWTFGGEINLNIRKLEMKKSENRMLGWLRDFYILKVEYIKNNHILKKKWLQYIKSNIKYI